MGEVRKHPQSAYSGLQNSLQQEWAFVQQVTPSIGDTFSPVDKSLQETSFLELFEGLGEGSLE